MSEADSARTLEQPRALQFEIFPQSTWRGVSVGRGRVATKKNTRCDHWGVATKAPPLSESHPDIAGRWVGNVKADDLRTPEQFSM